MASPRDNDYARDQAVLELRDIACTLKTGFEWFKSHANLATKDDLKHLGEQIMSAISDYTAAVDAHLDGIGTNVDGLVEAVGGISTSIGGISGDVTELKRLLEEINNNPGPISSEDQARLTASLDRVATLATKVQAAKDAAATAAAAAKALDDATENVPTPPPV